LAFIIRVRIFHDARSCECQIYGTVTLLVIIIIIIIIIIILVETPHGEELFEKALGMRTILKQISE
jgi:hypothetical protein